MNSTVKSLVFWSILFVVGLLVWNFSSRLQRNENRVAFSEFVSWVDAGQVQRVEIVGNDITGVTKGLENFRTYAPFQYEGLANRLIERGVSRGEQGARPSRRGRPSSTPGRRSC